MFRKSIFLSLSLFLALIANAHAKSETISLQIKNHHFEPAEITASANQPLVLSIHNADPTPEEFESDSLKREKIIPGNATVTIRLKPLKPGNYPFYGEFNPDTAQGVLVIR